MGIDITKSPISFVQVNSLGTNKRGDKYLNFNIWEEHKDSINTSAYRYMVNLDEAYNILDKLQQRGVPCNFYLGQLKDEKILVELAKVGASVYFNNIDIDSDQINHIELRAKDNSMYLNLNKFIKNGIEFFDEGLNDYFSFFNLILNSKNTNLSVRLFTEEDGYRTRFIRDIFSKEVLNIRALEPIVGLRTLNDWEQKEDGYWHNSVRFILPSEDIYDLFINDKRTEDMEIFNVTSMDYYLKEFGKYFYMTLISNFVSAWISFFISNSLEAPKQKSEYTKTSRASQDRSVEVKVPYHTPRIVDFKRLIAETGVAKNQENMPKFLESLRYAYGENVYEYIRNFVNVSSKALYARYMNIKILNDAIKYELAIRTVRAAIIKETIKNDLNMQNIFRNGTEYSRTFINSPIFKFSIKITIY